MKRILSILFLLVTLLQPVAAQNSRLPVLPKSAVNFMVVSDLGRNGYYEQKPIAKLMGETAAEISLEYIIAAGDTHHFEGIASTQDPLWMTNYELIYDHPELMKEWWAICGNHEYRGNTDAVLEYSNISRRWHAPSRYYAKTLSLSGNKKCLLLFIDTTPLIDKYRSESEKYPDAIRQDREQQLQWIEQQLKESDADWKIVIGHHPVYAQTPKSADERADMQKYVGRLLEKYGVHLYMAGHIHNFQHLQPVGEKTHYVVNSSASLSRKVERTEGTIFCNPDPGFTICSLTPETLSFYFINHKGETIYKYDIKK